MTLVDRAFEMPDLAGNIDGIVKMKFQDIDKVQLTSSILPGHEMYI